MYYDDEKLMRIRANRHRRNTMSEKELPESHSLLQAIEVDAAKEGLNHEELVELSKAMTALAQDKACNVLLVIQGEDGTMCTSDGQIAPTKAMHVMQILCAGVFSGMADEDERTVLDAVSQSVAKKLGVDDDLPKIIYN